MHWIMELGLRIINWKKFYENQKIFDKIVKTYIQYYCN